MTYADAVRRHFENVAVFYIKREEPIPVDLETKIFLAGVDVEYLREKHTPQ